MLGFLKRTYKSFSFRLTFISLFLFLVVLLLLRYSIYYSAVEEAEGDIKSVVEGQMMEIADGIKKHGVEYGLNVISSIIENDREKMFVIAFTDSKGNVLEGNLKSIPDMTPLDGKWGEFEVQPVNDEAGNDPSATRDDDDDNNEPRLFMATIKNYPKGSKLLVGYDVKHVENIKQIVWDVLWQNIILSLFAAIFCSLVITFIISKRLRLLNNTCEDVIHGKLEKRVQLTGSDDEFDRLGQNFNSMLGWINQLISNTKETTDNLAHDMRTPLNRHRIRLEEIIYDSSTPPETREHVTEAVKEIDRIVEMFNSILSISKAEAKSDIKEFTRFDLRELIDDLLDLYGFLAEQKQIEVIYNVPDKIEFKGDRQLFAQALMNLIDNAVKYTPEGGRIEFNVEENDDEVIFTLADSGEGIPEEFYEKVRERFYRLDKSRTTSGSGLGLSLVDAVVKLHGGQMEFSDNKPGLRVKLTFPNN